MFEEHAFYCMKCGHRGIPLARRTSHQHERFHRKKLYCPYCKEEVNHIECKNEADIEEFLKNFNEGVYANEVEDSVAHCRSTWKW